MSDVTNASLTLEGVGKMYKLFDSKRDNFLDALNLSRLRPWRPVKYREFWALRGIDLVVPRGGRIGIVGRNGAGKSTLLKLVTGNLAVTEGAIGVNGTVQALLDAGGGLHPEFTGHENIRAALTYQGLDAEAARRAEREIAEFTELGSFLQQQFKTFSTGMQARLAFAVATTIDPDILIIDEILGAGDAYFFSKSMGRMKDLVEGGASVLLVSHALDQIQRFCPETIWLERGQIVEYGRTADVIRSYERFIRGLENRRLRSKSERLLADRRGDASHDLYGERLVVRFSVPTGVQLAVASLELLRDGVLEDELAVGAPQDADTTASAYVEVDSGEWSGPELALRLPFRRLERSDSEAFGRVIFNLWSAPTSAVFTLIARFRTSASGARMELVSGDRVISAAHLEASGTGWQVARLEVKGSAIAPVAVPVSRAPQPDTAGRGGKLTSVPPGRWPGEGKLRVAGVQLLDASGSERAVFNVGESFRFRVTVRAEESGRFPIILAGLVVRLDGVVVSRHVTAETLINLGRGETIITELDLGPLNLGNGYYSFSVGLYRRLDIHDIDPSRYYDNVDRGYEFQIVGAPKMHNELLVGLGVWQFVQGPPERRALPPLWEPPTLEGSTDRQPDEPGARFLQSDG